MTPPVDAEQEFLLRSLDDLEVERDAGDIDDETYERLHSDYTARAAASIRAATGAGVDPAVEAGAPPISGRRRALTIGAIVAFGVVAALVLASALGGRMPGQTGSDNTATVSQADRRRTLERAIRADPRDPQGHLALARFLMARRQYPGAFTEFSTVSALDPTNTESRAYSGWLLYLAGRVDDAVERIDAALALDESYPDAHFFKGVALFRAKSDPAGAIPQFQRYLTLVPDGPLADEVRGLLAEAVDASDPSRRP